MKIFKNTLLALIIVVFAAGLALNFNACTNNETLQGPETKSLSDTNGLNILKIGNGKSSLKKATEVSRWITVEHGGTLELYHEGDNSLYVEISLQILSETLNQDAQVKMTLDDEQFIGNLDVVFDPHSITFSEPAILNIEAKNIDLTGINPNSLDIYYVNQETGQWEKMERDAIYVDEDLDVGEIQVVNAQLPHFSRYAIGMY